MYGGGGYGQKIDCQVDFPLDGLDLTDLVKGEFGRDNKSENGERLIYDCYAVSNHFGNMGFGHYTAFCRNPQDDKWYEFDDSRCSQVRDARSVVSSAAYNLFFRRRDWHAKNMEKDLDYKALAVKPDE